MINLKSVLVALLSNKQLTCPVCGTGGWLQRTRWMEISPHPSSYPAHSSLLKRRRWCLLVSINIGFFLQTNNPWLVCCSGLSNSHTSALILTVNSPFIANALQFWFSFYWNASNSPALPSRRASLVPHQSCLEPMTLLHADSQAADQARGSSIFRYVMFAHCCSASLLQALGCSSACMKPWLSVPVMSQRFSRCVAVCVCYYHVQHRSPTVLDWHQNHLLWRGRSLSQPSATVVKYSVTQATALKVFDCLGLWTVLLTGLQIYWQTVCSF